MRRCAACVHPELKGKYTETEPKAHPYCLFNLCCFYLCCCKSVWKYLNIYYIKVKETPCAPVAPNDKPSPVGPTRAQPTTNQQVCGCKHAWTWVDFEKSHRKDILNWNLHVPVQLTVFHHFRQTPLDPWFDFTHLLTRCPSCYPKIGGWADPQWGRPQACEEDLHRWWQRCNSPQSIFLFGLDLPGFTKALVNLSQMLVCQCRGKLKKRAASQSAGLHFQEPLVLQ